MMRHVKFEIQIQLSWLSYHTVTLIGACCKVMDYLSMDDDIDLENELLQEQSLYELNYGEEEHAADNHHDILDSEKELHSNTTAAHRVVSSAMPDKLNPMFDSSKSVYTQDKSSAIDNYNSFKDYTRFYDMHHSP